jgi:hypothetical protein
MDETMLSADTATIPQEIAFMTMKRTISDTSFEDDRRMNPDFTTFIPVADDHHHVL